MSTKPRLVFVEGLPASGKSSISQLVNIIQGNGVWYHELQPESPLYVAHNHFLNEHYGLEEIHSVFAALSVDQNLIFDSRLFLIFIYPALLKAADPNFIKEYLVKNFKVIARHSPSLILLKNGEVKDEFIKAIGKRSDPIYYIRKVEESEYAKKMNPQGLVGEDLLIKFWSEVFEIMKWGFQAFEGSKIVIDVSKQTWESVEKEVFSFLNVPYDLSDRENFSDAYLSRFEGTFKSQPGDVIQIRKGRHCLEILGFKGTKFPYDASEDRALPKANGNFVLSQFPWEVRFVEKNKKIESVFIQSMLPPEQSTFYKEG